MYCELLFWARPVQFLSSKYDEHLVVNIWCIWIHNAVSWHEKLVWSNPIWSDLMRSALVTMKSWLHYQTVWTCCVWCVVNRFLLGPPNMADKSNIGRIPRVHLSTSNSADEAEECFLIVYRLFSATICLLVKGQFQLLFVADECNIRHALDSNFQNLTGAGFISSYPAGARARFGIKLLYFHKIGFLYLNQVTQQYVISLNVYWQLFVTIKCEMSTS